MLTRIWRTIKLVAIVFGVCLAFFALVEVLQAYQVLRGVHPFFGYLFVCVVLIGLGWITAYYIISMLRRPTVLIPPPKRDMQTASSREVRKYAKYLSGVMDRLSNNDLVPEGERQQLEEKARMLLSEAKSTSDARLLIPVLTDHETEIILPVVKLLDEEAERKVRACVRDTMVAVAVSPWRSTDLMVVIYRNYKMVLDLTRIYNSRPHLKEQVSVFGDVLKIVATVQFLNLGSKFVENLASCIPVVGRFTDDIAQGVGAGLITSLAGHTTMGRCRSFTGWSEDEATSDMAAKLKSFIKDLRGIVRDSVIPALKGRIEAETPEGKNEDEFLDQIRAGTDDAIERTGEVADSYVKTAFAAVGTGVNSTSAVIREGVKKGFTGTSKAMSWTAQTTWKGLANGSKVATRGAVGAVKGVAVGGKRVGKGSSQVIGKLAGKLHRKERMNQQDDDNAPSEK